MQRIVVKHQDTTVTLDSIIVAPIKGNERCERRQTPEKVDRKLLYNLSPPRWVTLAQRLLAVDVLYVDHLLPCNLPHHGLSPGVALLKPTRGPFLSSSRSEINDAPSNRSYAFTHTSLVFRTKKPWHATPVRTLLSYPRPAMAALPGTFWYRVAATTLCSLAYMELGTVAQYLANHPLRYN